MLLILADEDKPRDVSYNPYLLQKYGAHTNVEICTSVNAVKDLYKYVDARYMTSSEAVWRTMGFEIWFEMYAHMYSNPKIITMPTTYVLSTKSAPPTKAITDGALGG